MFDACFIALLICTFSLTTSASPLNLTKRYDVPSQTPEYYFIYGSFIKVHVGQDASVRESNKFPKYDSDYCGIGQGLFSDKKCHWMAPMAVHSFGIFGCPRGYAYSVSNLSCTLRDRMGSDGPENGATKFPVVFPAVFVTDEQGRLRYKSKIGTVWEPNLDVHSVLKRLYYAEHEPIDKCPGDYCYKPQFQASGLETMPRAGEMTVAPLALVHQNGQCPKGYFYVQASETGISGNVHCRINVLKNWPKTDIIP